MGGVILVLVLLALGSASGGTVKGGFAGGAKKPGKLPGLDTIPQPAGNPPGGCRKVWATENATRVVLAGLGYNPGPANIFGPDGKLGTGDAEPDNAIAQLQIDYNIASTKGLLGDDAGGLEMDGMMGPCTMAGMAHIIDTFELGPRFRQELAIS